MRRSLLLLFCTLLLASCYNKGPITPDAWNLTEQQLDSISFYTTHHYSQGYNFVVSKDSLVVLDSNWNLIINNYFSKFHRTMSIAIPQLPKGTRDFYPEAERIQNYIFDTWRKVAESFAYEEYEGPMFEHLELYTGKSGEEIVSQLYNFKDKGDREIALRPEMTPTLARLVIQKARELKKPFKWFSMPRLFRYEKAQKGRLREFFQLNMDIIGTESIYAEADLLASIATMLRKFGLKDGEFAIGVSSRKLLATYLEEIGAPNPSLVYPVLDRRLKIGPEAFAKALADAGLTEEQVKKLDDFMSCKSLEEVRAAVKSENAAAALKEIEDLFETLAAAGYGDCVNLDLSIVRGLAYYTGIVFEVFDKGSRRSVPFSLSRAKIIDTGTLNVKI